MTSKASVAALVSVAVIGGALGLSSAAGLSPRTLLQRALAHTAPVPGAFNPDLSTGRYLMTTAGPFGRPMQVWYSAAHDNGYCISFLQRMPVSPRGMHVVGGGCSGDVGDRWWNTFGADAFSAGRTFVVRVPGAVTVKLVVGNRSARQLPIAEHWTAGTLSPAENAAGATIVGYDAAGRAVGSRRLG